MKIMVIEDEIHLLEIYREILQSYGHTIETYSDPSVAIKRLDHSFDVVITDKKMPIMSGLEVIDYVEENYCSIPVFLITGEHSQPIEFKNSLSFVFYKPVSFESIIQKIDKLKS